ncbi:metallophosphoesterase [Gordonia sinesedis]
MVVVAHISDLHFNGTRINRARVESTLGYVNAHADEIDALLITGDIADEGGESEYAEALRVLVSPLPTLITVGNHDIRERFSSVMLGVKSSAPVNWAQLVDGVLLMVLDSSIPGRNEGYLSDDTLAWASDQIAAAGPDVPVLLAFHHPPVTLGMPFMDSIRLTGPERLAELVDRHPGIIGFLCGHAHSPTVTEFAGRPVCVAPGVASTLNLPFEGHDIVNRGQPPGIAFHIIDDRRMITHFRAVMF